MKKLKAVLVGAGNRGQVYCDYSFSCPDELEIVSVVDINEFRLQEVAQKYGLSENRAFLSVEDFLKANIECDFVVDATMDEMHYETALQLIGAGYNLILEKPVTPNYAQFHEIEELAKEKGVKVLVCHVLRYTPFYRTIKGIIESGKIGCITSIEMNEHVGIAHFLDSYVRGKWNSEEKCGSGFLLAKCCHDTDLMCWLNGASVPERVSSFGTRGLFAPENAPEGATAYCYECPHNATCLYSAQKVHLEFDSLPFQTWAEMNKPLDEITKEEKAEYLKWHTYGKCAYNSGGDIVDRQVVSVMFKNGSIATLNMIGGASKAGRWLHIVGSKGEIVGYVEEAKFKLITFDRGEGVFTEREEEIDVSSQIVANALYSGHAGGDYALMHDAIRFFAGEGASISITSIDDSVNGHLIAYAAEESRREEKIVRIAEFKEHEKL